MDDLNKRAAILLGCKEYKNNEALLIVAEELYPTIKQSSCFLNELKFTSSYDWAMLGIKKLDRFQIPEVEDLLGDNGKSLKSCLQATPEEITRAWVEVLEGV